MTTRTAPGSYRGMLYQDLVPRTPMYDDAAAPAGILVQETRASFVRACAALLFWHHICVHSCMSEMERVPVNRADALKFRSLPAVMNTSFSGLFLRLLPLPFCYPGFTCVGLSSPSTCFNRYRRLSIPSSIKDSRFFRLLTTRFMDRWKLRCMLRLPVSYPFYTGLVRNSQR
jgi:hypothetical protein